MLAVVGVGLAFAGVDRDQTPPVAGELPSPPAGMKWSGIGRSVVAVPSDWSMWPGLYCGSDDGQDHVTILRAGVVAGCPAAPGSIPSGDLIALREQNGKLAAVEVETNGPHPATTQRRVEGSRTTLPAGWLAVPSGFRAKGVGEPSADDELKALEEAGFTVERVQMPTWGDGPRVWTDPEIGAPAMVGSTVTLYERVPATDGGTLSGRLLWVGGPAGTATPHTGTVRVVGQALDVYVLVRADGHWSFQGPAGSYTVTGSSPGYLSRKGIADSCRADGPVHVSAGHSAQADVVCPLR